MDFSEMVADFVRNTTDGEKVLARQFGCSLPTVRRWANGENQPDPLFRERVVVFIANHGSPETE